MEKYLITLKKVYVEMHREGRLKCLHPKTLRVIASQFYYEYNFFP